MYCKLAYMRNWKLSLLLIIYGETWDLVSWSSLFSDLEENSTYYLSSLSGSHYSAFKIHALYRVPEPVSRWPKGGEMLFYVFTLKTPSNETESGCLRFHRSWNMSCHRQFSLAWSDGISQPWEDPLWALRWETQLSSQHNSSQNNSYILF